MTYGSSHTFHESSKMKFLSTSCMCSHNNSKFLQYIIYLMNLLQKNYSKLNYDHYYYMSIKLTINILISSFRNYKIKKCLFIIEQMMIILLLKNHIVQIYIKFSLIWSKYTNNWYFLFIKF